jgi:hypothetical protein
MAHRQFSDRDGTRWDVWDVHPTSAVKLLDLGSGATTTRTHGGVAPALANGWLCFQRAEDRRRLTPVPLGWEQLDDRALERLCEAATPVIRGPKDQRSALPAASDRPASDSRESPRPPS